MLYFHGVIFGKFHTIWQRRGFFIQNISSCDRKKLWFKKLIFCNRSFLGKWKKTGLRLEWSITLAIFTPYPADKLQLYTNFEFRLYKSFFKLERREIRLISMIPTDRICLLSYTRSRFQDINYSKVLLNLVCCYIQNSGLCIQQGFSFRRTLKNVKLVIKVYKF